MSPMRADDRQPDSMFSYVSAELRVPQDHPLRAIRALGAGARCALGGSHQGFHVRRLGDALLQCGVRLRDRPRLQVEIRSPARTQDYEIFAAYWPYYDEAAPPYSLPPSQFTPGSTTFTATGPMGPIDGRFFGPQPGKSNPMEIPELGAVLQSLDHGLRRSVRSQSQRRLPRLCIEGGSQ
jgi:hypothetical protein